jgi:succinate dehydrogenase / fumarate reductase flavoprotein subunit
MDLSNLLTVSEAITRCAIERKESRGGHFRYDYPNKGDSFGKFNFVIQKGTDGKMQLKQQSIPEMRADLKQVIEEMK